MQKKKLGKTNIEITDIALGTWVFGGVGWGGADDAESIKTIEAALELGINFFDTAPVYGSGKAEKLLGKVVKKCRENVIIASKISDFSNGMEASVDKSLQDLKMDYIDLFFIHWPIASVPIEKMMQDINNLKEKGKIKAIGVSNFSIEQLKRAMRVTNVDAIQPPYNLFWRFIEDDIMPYCIQNDISIIPYSPLARGIFSGKFTPNWVFKQGDNRVNNVLFLKEHFEDALEGVEKIKKIAAEKGTSVSSIAIKWVIMQNGITSILLGARNVNQLKQNLKVLSIELSLDEIKKLDDISKKVLKPIKEKGYDNPFNWEGYKKI